MKFAKMNKPEQAVRPGTSKPGCVKRSEKKGKISHTKWGWPGNS